MIRLRNLRSGDLVQLDWKVGSGDLILPDLESSWIFISWQQVGGEGWGGRICALKNFKQGSDLSVRMKKVDLLRTSPGSEHGLDIHGMKVMRHIF